MRTVILLVLLLLGVCSCSDYGTYVQEVNIPLEVRYSVGFGSGAFHHPSDEKDLVYFITDRGPNIPVEDPAKKSGKIFPVPAFTPTIYKIKVGNSSYEVLEKIELKNSEGKLVTGLTNPNTEVAYDLNGNVLRDDPNGLDTEAIVKLRDGTFWISEEYGPSLLHVDKEGKILTRWTPKDKLPAIISKRKVNRGIEAMAISPDENFIYFVMQSPLANPNNDTCRASKIVRLFRVDIKKGTVDREYIYVLDDAATFANDRGLKQGEIKISEMVMLDYDELFVLERAENTTKFYKIKLSDATNVIGTKWDDLKTKPTLEELNPKSLYDKGIRTFTKNLVLDTAKSKFKFPAKLEGMTYLGKGRWLLVNDNDFGINGAETIITSCFLHID